MSATTRSTNAPDHGAGTHDSTTPDSTMQAVVQDGYGFADVLRVARIDNRRSATTTSSSRCTPPGSTVARGT